MSEDTLFLQKTVGPFLTRALTDTLVQQPSDPVEYLALYMLHEVQQNRLVKDQEGAKEEIEKQKEEFSQGVEDRQNEAAKIIQDQIRKTLAGIQERKEKETQLVEKYKEKCVETATKIQEEEIDVDEEFAPQKNEEEGENEEENEGEGEKKPEEEEEVDEDQENCKSNVVLAEYKVKFALEALGKVGNGVYQKFLKRLGNNEDVLNVLQCAQLLLDRRYIDLRSSDALKKFLPQQINDFIRHLRMYKPRDNQRKKKYQRVKRKLQKIEDPESLDVISYFVYQFVTESQVIRKNIKELNKIQKKEVEIIPEDKDDSVDSDNENVDSDLEEAAPEENGEENGEDGEEEDDE